MAQTNVANTRAQLGQALVDHVRLFESKISVAARGARDQLPKSGESVTLQVLGDLGTNMRYSIPGVRIGMTDRFVSLADYARILIDRLSDTEVVTVANDLSAHDPLLTAPIPTPVVEQAS